MRSARNTASPSYASRNDRLARLGQLAGEVFASTSRSARRARQTARPQQISVCKLNARASCARASYRRKVGRVVIPERLRPTAASASPRVRGVRLSAHPKRQSGHDGCRRTLSHGKERVFLKHEAHAFGQRSAHRPRRRSSRCRRRARESAMMSSSEPFRNRWARSGHRVRGRNIRAGRIFKRNDATRVAGRSERLRAPRNADACIACATCPGAAERFGIEFRTYPVRPQRAHLTNDCDSTLRRPARTCRL